MKFIELFAGIGGMGYGLMNAGMECVGFVEWDKYAHKAFKLLHDPAERMWARHDITSVTNDDIRLLGGQHKVELISGGFPCQSFSIAGKRQGFADRTRGTLFFEIIRFAEILKPKFLLLENVKGLLNHDGGRTYATILCALDELGYDCEWQLLNSKNYVPQNRERIFIVGHLRGTNGRKVFPFGGENSKISKYIGSYNGVKRFLDVYGVLDSKGICTTLTTMQGGGREPKVMVLGNISKTGHHGEDVHDICGLSPTVNASASKHPILINGQYHIRKLTPLECFRLQSFPDDWYYTLKEHNISDSQLYKMAGNGVTSAVAYEIGKRLMEVSK